ncbi:MAG: hypothetical protein K5770_06255 [Lachnospiraceae bacterium]|nr:hypothetical protein [Lachnospiraceae bacterium]
MSELSENIKAMTENIEGYCTLLLSGDLVDKEQIKPALKAGFDAIIGEMLVIYDRPELSGVRADREYWSAQKGRIFKAIDSEDVFFTIDVLRNETEENLKLFMKML